MVTNGVVRDQKRFLDLLTRYGMETTVSLDGPAFLHDQLRPYANAAPSYDRAAGTVSALVHAQLPVAIQTVYTARHVEAEFSIVDVLKFCQGLGVNKIIFDIAYPPAPAERNRSGSILQQYLAHHKEAYQWLRALIAGQAVLSVYFRDLLLPLLDGSPAIPLAESCAAAEADFAIGPTGICTTASLLRQLCISYGQRAVR